VTSVSELKETVLAKCVRLLLGMVGSIQTKRFASCFKMFKSYDIISRGGALNIKLVSLISRIMLKDAFKYYPWLFGPLEPLSNTFLYGWDKGRAAPLYLLTFKLHSYFDIEFLHAHVLTCCSML
jgi:hypothetical protein